jgi:hypothetical protein
MAAWDLNVMAVQNLVNGGAQVPHCLHNCDFGPTGTG